MIDLNDLASEHSIDLCKEMRKIMKEKRLEYLDPDTGKPISLRALATKGGLDPAILHRAENPSVDSIPALAFWIDWVNTMEDSGLTLQKVMDEALSRLE